LEDKLYFQITFDSKRISSWFGMVWASILAFGVNCLVTKRRKRIIILWLLRKDLKYNRQARKEQMYRMFGYRKEHHEN